MTGTSPLPPNRPVPARARWRGRRLAWRDNLPTTTAPAFRSANAGGDGVHGDSELADFARQGASKADDAGFRGRVVQPVGRSFPHPRRRDVDDLAAPLRLHRREYRAAGYEHAAQIDCHD